MELRGQILDAAARLFQAKGLSFTMQQVAAALLLDMVDMLFEKIHRRKAELAALPGLLEERLQAVIIALPEEYAALDFRQLDTLEEKYPAVAARVRRHLETGWEPTIYEATITQHCTMGAVGFGGSFAPLCGAALNTKNTGLRKKFREPEFFL